MPFSTSPGDFESVLKPLWLRAQSGDEAAYRQCLGMLAARLRGYLKRRLSGFPDEVEDLVQETLLALHLQRGTYDPSAPGRWLSRGTNWWIYGGGAVDATTCTTM
jgi:RNA polymerase sigma-70 factor (ECF subfamily)